MAQLIDATWVSTGGSCRPDWNLPVRAKATQLVDAVRSSVGRWWDLSVAGSRSRSCMSPHLSVCAWPAGWCRALPAEAPSATVCALVRLCVAAVALVEADAASAGSMPGRHAAPLVVCVQAPHWSKAKRRLGSSSKRHEAELLGKAVLSEEWFVDAIFALRVESTIQDGSEYWLASVIKEGGAKGPCSVCCLLTVKEDLSSRELVNPK
jgi:hypothetical protein